MEKDAIFVKIKLSASNIEKKETECSYCSNKTKKFYSSEQKLKKHIIYDHLNFSRNVQVPTTILYKYYCPVESCRKHEKFDEKFFITKKHLVQHYMKIHNLEKFKCEKCDKKFSTEYLKKKHSESCGKVYVCLVCSSTYNSYEALVAHSKRKNHQHENMTKEKTQKVKTIDRETLAVPTSEKRMEIPSTRTVSTTTTEFSSSLPSKLTTTSVFTSTGDLRELPMDSPSLQQTSSLETKATTTDDILLFLNDDDLITPTISKPIKNSATSTIDFFNDNEDTNFSSNSSNKKNLNLNSAINFNEDSLGIFNYNNNYTQTDFGSLFNNNYTQTCFADFDLFGKFDSQTQTNFNDFSGQFDAGIDETIFTSTETQTMMDEDVEEPFI